MESATVSNVSQMQLGDNSNATNKKRRVRRSRGQLHAAKAEHAQRPLNVENSTEALPTTTYGPPQKSKTPFQLMEEQEARDDRKYARKEKKRARRQQVAQVPKDTDKDLADIVSKKPRIRLPKPKPKKTKIQQIDAAAHKLMAEARRLEKNKKVHEARVEKGLPCQTRENSCACYHVSNSLAKEGDAIEGRMLNDLGFQYQVNVDPMTSMLQKLEMF